MKVLLAALPTAAMVGGVNRVVVGPRLGVATRACGERDGWITPPLMHRIRIRATARVATPRRGPTCVPNTLLWHDKHIDISLLISKYNHFMKKKLLITRWLALALCFAATIPASAYDFIVDGIAYNILNDGQTVEVTRENASEPAYNNLIVATIPNEVSYNGNNYLVDGIAANAFKGCNKLETVTIGIKPRRCTGDCATFELTLDFSYIGDKAFSGCTSLKLINITHAYWFGYCGDNIFENVNKNTCILKVPDGYFGECSGLDFAKEFKNVYEQHVDFMVDGLPYRITDDSTVNVTRLYSLEFYSLEINYWVTLLMAFFLEWKTTTFRYLKLLHLVIRIMLLRV